MEFNEAYTDMRYMYAHQRRDVSSAICKATSEADYHDSAT